MNPELNKTTIKKLAKEYGTGKYIFSEARFHKNIRDIRAAFSGMAPGFILAYSVKANYAPVVLHAAKKEELIFDVASLMELNQVLKAGVVPGKIWLNTPYLTDELLKKCIRLNIQVHADTPDQLRRIRREAVRQNKKACVGIRFNFPGPEQSRFGIECSKNSLAALKKFMSTASSLKLTTLHFHYSGPDRSAAAFSRRLEVLLRLYSDWFKNSGVKILNIGGGLSGPMCAALAKQFPYPLPSWSDYGGTLEKHRKALHAYGITLAIEPGMALVADAFYFLAEVIQVKSARKKNFALLNSSKIFLKPTGHNKSLAFEVLNQRRSASKIRYELTGITCMENDVLGHYNGALRGGDLVLFKNVGAYTLSYRPNFIFAEPETIFLKM